MLLYLLLIKVIATVILLHVICYYPTLINGAGDLVRAKPGTEPGVRNLLTNCPTVFAYKFRPAQFEGLC